MNAVVISTNLSKIKRQLPTSSLRTVGLKTRCFHSFPRLFKDSSTSNIENQIINVEFEIKRLGAEIDSLNVLIRRDISEWSKSDLQAYVDVDGARREKESLRRKEELLLKKSLESPVPVMKAKLSIEVVIDLLEKENSAFKFNPNAAMKMESSNAFNKTVDRESTFFSLFINLYGSLHKRKTQGDKRFNEILVVGGGPGSGKSHVLDVLSNRLQELASSKFPTHKSLSKACNNHLLEDSKSEHVDFATCRGLVNVYDKSDYEVLQERVCNSLHIPITFNGASQVSSDESYPLQMRVLYSYVVRNSPSIAFEIFSQLILKNFDMIPLVELNGLLLKHSKKSCTIMTIDELNKGMAVHSSIFGQLSPLMDDMDARCFVVASALRSKELVSYQTFSGRSLKFVMLPPLTQASVESELFEPREYSANEMRIAELCYGHPRSLEYLRLCISDDRKAGTVDFLTLFDRVVERLSGRYNFFTYSLDILNTVIVKREMMCLSDHVSGSLSFGDGIANGFFYNRIDAGDVPFVTPLFFHGFLRHLGPVGKKISQELCQSELPSNADGNRLGMAFEIHHSSWEILFRLLLKKKGQSFVSFRDLYRFTGVNVQYGNANLKNIKFCLGDFPDIRYKTAFNLEEFIKSEAKFISDFFDQGLIVCFGNTCPGFDTVLFTHNADGEKALIFFELRYSLEASQTSEGIPSVIRKHALIMKQLKSLKKYSKDFANINWYLVYAGYRDHSQSFIHGGKRNKFKDGLPSNAVYLDRAVLEASYGTSYYGEFINGQVVNQVSDSRKKKKNRPRSLRPRRP